MPYGIRLAESYIDPVTSREVRVDRIDSGPFRTLEQAKESLAAKIECGNYAAARLEIIEIVGREVDGQMLYAAVE